MPVENRGFGALFAEKKDQLDHLQAKMASIIPAFPGQNVAKFFDLALGIDFHSTVFPPSPLLPVPHIGMVFDIMGAVMSAIASALPAPPPPPEDGSEAPVTVLSVATAIVGALKPSVKVHNQWVANAGTSIQHLPAIIAHILPVVSPMASSEMWMGSSTVLADGGPCSTQFHPALSCNIVGIPSIGRRNKPPRPKMALMAPTSMLLIITSGGKPVMVGGPPTIDLFQLMFKMALKGLGKVWKKAKGKAKAPDTKTPGLGKAQPEVKKKCLTDPVDVATGAVVAYNTDFELPGPIPFIWNRIYYSNVQVNGPMGYNRHHSYNMGSYDMGNDWFTIRLKDGRETSMPALATGDAYYDREEQLLWQRDAAGYQLVDTEKYIYRFNGPLNKEGFRMLSSIETMAGFKITFRYNQAAFLHQIIDSCGRPLFVENDHEGRVVRIYSVIKDGELDHVRYSYDDQGNLSAKTDALGHSKHFFYEGHLLTHVINPDGFNFYWEYQGYGDSAKCVHAWGDDSVLEYWFRYEDGRTIARNSLGHSSEYYYDERFLLYKMIDANGGVTHNYYNEDGELEIVVNPEGLSTRYYYNNWGKLEKLINENDAESVYAYDEQLNLTSVTTPGGAGYLMRYDHFNRIIYRRNADGAELNYYYKDLVLDRVVDHKGRCSRFTYDKHYNLIRLDLPNNTYMAWSYDELRRVTMATDVEGNNTWYTYDAAGNLIGVEQADGTKHHASFDAMGNLTAVKDNNGRDVQFTYGPMGVMTSRSQGDRSIQFRYDTELQLKAIANEVGDVYKLGLDPVGNIVSEWSFDGLRRQYIRDGIGRPVKTLRPDGRWLSCTYDGTGNIISEEYHDGNSIAYKYNRDGLLTEALNSESHIRIFRDRAGRIIKEQQGNYSVERKYDSDGNCVFIASNLGAAIEQQYSEEGLLSAIHAKNSNEPDSLWSASWKRNNSGLELFRELTGGVRVKTERDKLGRIQRSIVDASAVGESSIRYEWGRGYKLNRIVNELTQAKTEYTYDVFGNLVAEAYQQRAVIENIYRVPDKVSNLFSGPARTDKVYGKGGRLLEDESFFYHHDAEGNLVFKEFKYNENRHAEDKTPFFEALGIQGKGSATGWLYSWTASGMLQKVTNPAGKQVSFHYDALGRRIAKQYKSQVTRWVWDGNVPLHEWNYTGEFPPMVSVDADGEILETAEPVQQLITWIFEEERSVPCAKLIDKKVYSILTNHIGTPTHAFDENGNSVWERALDCYGRPLLEKGENGFVPYLYQGQYIDAETGLAYNRFRYYDPEIGRYISQDPIGLNGGTALYAYVGDTNTSVDVFGWWSELLPSGMGHHLFPRAVAKKLGIEELSQKTSISWYPNKTAGSDVLHGEMHGALKEAGIPIHGSKFEGTTDEAFEKMKEAYKGFTEKGFLKIPGKKEKLFTNLTPGEAIDKIKELYEQGKLKPCS